MRAKPLLARLRRALGLRAADLDALVEEAAAAGAHAFLVGGPVRDLLIGAPVLDVDVLLSRGLERVARRLAARLGGRATLHERFLTATVQGAAGRIDLARARSESYARPGALPSVRPATVAQDLGRRDFSVNALALPLAEAWGGELLDPCGGLEDLSERRLRVLHDASFRDDPTRLLRAGRYAARLGFALEADTARLARAALRAGALDTVSADRLRHEVERLLEEPDPGGGVASLRGLGVWRALVPGWRPFARGPLARLAESRTQPPWRGADAQGVRRACAWALLLLGSAAPVRRRAIARLGLRGQRARDVEADLAALARVRRSLTRPLSDGRLDRRLGGVPERALLLAWCAAPAPVAKQVAHYVNALRDAPGPIDGQRARALGASGPAVGALLRAARQRALDGGEVDDAWLRRWLARHG